MSEASFPDTRLSLLDALKQEAGNGPAWALFVQKYGAILYRWCRQNGLNQHDAEDQVHDLFLQLAKALGQFTLNSEKGRFRAWLRTVTVNAVNNTLRKGARQARAVGGDASQEMLGQLEDRRLSLEQSLEQALREDMLQQAMANVQTHHSAERWQWFTDRKLKGVGLEELVRRSGQSYATVSGTVFRINQAVIEEFRRLWGEDLAVSST